MSQFGYSNQRRSVSPILKTTSEDRRVLHHNKENYIQYLEHQLEKTATMVNKKYEERMRGLEQLVQEHEDKFTNFIKLIKLLQNFAESQENENGNIKKYINTTMEQLYHNELRAINTSIHEIQHKIDQMQTFSFRESPALQEFEESVNKKIDIMMEEVKQTALKTDYQELEQRLSKLENIKQAEYNTKSQDFEKSININVQQQLTELKGLLDNVLKEQETLKTSVQTLVFDLSQQKASTASLPQRPSRKSELRQSQQSEQESLMKPIIQQKNTEQTDKKKKVKISKSRSESKNNTELKKKKKSEGQVKFKNIKSTSKLKN